MDSQDSPAEVPQHTPNYAGWASFEARVRGRRFARVVEQARSALDQGRIDDARAALAEARALSMDAPEIAELEARLAAPPAWNGELLLKPAAPAESVDVESDPGWFRVFAGMAVVTALLAFVGLGLVQVLHTSAARQLFSARNSTATTDVLQTDAADVSSAAVEPAQPPQPMPEPQLVRPEPPRRPQATRDPKPVAASRPPAARRVEPPSPPSTMGMRLRTPSAGTPTPPPSPDPSATATDAVAPVPVLDVPVHAARQVPDPGAREEESARIRTLLSRYETAYNRLDAKAASSVWPSVNQVALGRAFNGLISQRVSLGLCDITVIGDIAGASCAGKARWEPKVGGGLQTADRYWKFNLRKTDDGWRIQEIQVR